MRGVLGRFLVALWLVALCWGPSVASAQAPAQTPAAQPAAELFFRPAAVLKAELSPSGKRLALMTASGGERVGLFVWSLDDAGKAQQVARFSDGDVRDFNWLDDERLLFSVFDRSRGLMQQEAPGLYVIGVDGQGLRELVMRRFSSPLVEPRGGRAPPLEPDHMLLHVPRPGAGVAADEIVVGKMRWGGNRWTSVEPMRLNVRTGRAQLLDLKTPDNVAQWWFDSQGQPRLALVREEDRRRLHWRGAGETAWRVIDDRQIGSEAFWPHSVGDSGELFVTRSDGPAGLQVLTRFDFASGAPSPTPFVSTPGFDFRGGVIADHDGGRLLGVRVNTDAETTVWLDPELKRVQAWIDERFPGMVNRLSCRRCGAKDMVVLVRSSSDRDPGHLWLWRGDAPPDKPAQLLGRIRPGLDPERMASVDVVRIAARDGLELPVWLTVPPGRKAGDKGPAVVLVHGGPWSRGGAWEWDAMAQFLASRGYVVIEPEFRGSAGYGRRHLEAGNRQWGRAMQHDIADTARWALQQGWADRLCIAGGSYGGYSTLMGLIQDPDLFRCGAAWVAVADLFLFLEGSWWIDDDISREGRRYDLKRLVGDPEADAAMLREVSPLHQAARLKRPLLLVHGERDRRVPFAHAERMRKALQAAGNEPEWVTYPGEGHGWLKLANHVDFANRLEAFFGKHLGQP
jgi:acetyl esterase/lipase